MQYLLLLFILVSIQASLTLLQYRAVHRQFQLVKQRYPMVSVGKSKGVLVRTAILAFDKGGVLREAYLLSGMTVFARMRRMKRFEHMHHRDIKAACAGKRGMRCILHAIGFLEQQYEQRVFEEVAYD